MRITALQYGQRDVQLHPDGSPGRQPLTNIDASGASGTTTTVQVTYSDSASGVNVDPTTFGAGNISVINGSTTATVSNFSVSGNTVTYTVTAPGGNWGASAQGNYTVSVVAGSVTDSNGNPIAASTLGTFAVGTVVPTATISLASSQPTTAISGPILFTVAFQRSQSRAFRRRASRWAARPADTLVATVTAVTSVPSGDVSGQDYTVSVSGMTSSGTVTATVKAGAAQDAAGNDNTASTTVSVQFTEQFFNLTGKTLTITGTATQQTLLIEFADATDFTALIGGSSQTYSTTQVSTVNFNGNGTAATFVFAAPGATMGTVSASLVPGGGQIQGPTYTISISGAATNYFYGNSTSSLSMTDTAGQSNTFVANSSYAYEEPTNGSSYFNMAENFGTLSATAGTGTTDTAYFVSAPGDSIVDTATYGSLSATGVFYSANNFPTVYAFGSATGGDSAWLYGTSTGFSAFVGNSAYAYMQGIQINSSGNTNYFNSMIGFHSVQAIINSGGGGVATLNGLGSNPEFAAGAGAATMVGGGIQDAVQGFQTINAYAGSGSIALVDGIASHGNSLVRNNGVPTLVGGGDTGPDVRLRPGPAAQERGQRVGARHGGRLRAGHHPELGVLVGPRLMPGGSPGTQRRHHVPGKARTSAGLGRLPRQRGVRAGLRRTERLLPPAARSRRWPGAAGPVPCLHGRRSPCSYRGTGRRVCPAADPLAVSRNGVPHLPPGLTAALEAGRIRPADGPTAAHVRHDDVGQQQIDSRRVPIENLQLHVGIFAAGVVLSRVGLEAPAERL